MSKNSAKMFTSIPQGRSIPDLVQRCELASRQHNSRATLGSPGSCKSQCFQQMRDLFITAVITELQQQEEWHEL